MNIKRIKSDGMVGFCHCICDNGRNGHRRGTINGGVLGSGVGMEYKDNDIRHID